VCQTRIADFAGLGRGFLGRCGSRILRDGGSGIWRGNAETSFSYYVLGLGGPGCRDWQMETRRATRHRRGCLEAPLRLCAGAA